MSKASERVKKWRIATKERIVASMGGKCQICGYNKCTAALALHHKDPAKKELKFGALRASPRNWLAIVAELRKCVLVCNNCHAEIHSGVVVVPDDACSFDEDFVDYK